MGNFYEEQALLNEFSFDDRWNLPTYSTTLIIYTGLVIYNVYIAINLWKRDKFHVTVCAC